MIFHALKEQYGFGWDEEKVYFNLSQLIPTAPSNVWDSYLKAHTAAKPYRTETLRKVVLIVALYEDMHSIFQVHVLLGLLPFLVFLLQLNLLLI